MSARFPLSSDGRDHLLDIHTADKLQVRLEEGKPHSGDAGWWGHTSSPNQKRCAKTSAAVTVEVGQVASGGRTGLQRVPVSILALSAPGSRWALSRLNLPYG